MKSRAASAVTTTGVAAISPRLAMPTSAARRLSRSMRLAGIARLIENILIALFACGRRVVLDRCSATLTIGRPERHIGIETVLLNVLNHRVEAIASVDAVGGRTPDAHVDRRHISHRVEGETIDDHT